MQQLFRLAVSSYLTDWSVGCNNTAKMKTIHQQRQKKKTTSSEQTMVWIMPVSQDLHEMHIGKKVNLQSNIINRAV